MDLKRLWEAPLKVAPAQYFTVMEVDDTEAELARTGGVQAFFSGQAGDSVLQLMTEPLSAIDYAWLRGFDRELGQHLLAAARLSRQSVWGVLRKTVRHGFFHAAYRQADSAFLKRPTLLRAEILDDLTEHDFANPWRRAVSLLPPGKQDHVTGLVSSGYHNFIFRGGTHADYVDPLDSQPVWETMLQIPTYTIQTGGISRGLARVAFADVLPTEIRRRQAKGAGSSFYKTVVRANREFLFDVLREGYLARDGYLDRRKLDAYFRTNDSPRVVSPSQMLNYVAAEVWLQQCAQTNGAMRATRFAQSG
jgi:asparagine synthase (glutamine-hydrolysing)